MLIQGLLLQLWAPLQFLGWFYRELRSALVDMEEFFAILRTKPHIKVGGLQVFLFLSLDMLKRRTAAPCYET